MTEIAADAPGRVNLIGEHTDYQDGFVLPCAVPQRTYASLTLRSDRRVRVSSAQMEGDAREYDLGGERRGAGWIDYVQGVTWVAADQALPLGGFDLRIRSDVPLGSGLSSSAALEVSVMRALRTAFAWPLNDVDLARAAQRVETDFVGAPVGIMDQMASSLAGERDALFLDARSLDYERIPLPAGLELVVIDSGVQHQHAGGEYVTRRRESEEAARRLGVRRLRDVPVEELPRVETLPQVLARRARHIVSENARVVRAREALLGSELETLGALFNASHASMRDDYEVSIDAVDRLVAAATAQRHVFGARMTGGGFGGAVVIAAAAGHGVEIATQTARAYRAQTQRDSVILVPTIPR